MKLMISYPVRRHCLRAMNLKSLIMHSVTRINQKTHLRQAIVGALRGAAAQKTPAFVVLPDQK